MDNKNITVQEILLLLGEKDVQIYQLQRQVAELQRQLNSIEAKDTE